MVRAEELLSEVALEASLDRTPAVPFVEITPFFRDEFADALHDEFPDPGEMIERHSTRGVLQDLSAPVTPTTASRYGPATERLARFLFSDAYADFIRGLSGFEIDPSLCVPTYNTYRPGQHLDTHVDHRRASSGEVRPITQVIHLTKDWKDEYGGEFTLSVHEDLSDPVISVTPGFNTAVIFERTPDSWHGVTRIDTDEVYRKTLVIVAQARDLVSLLYAPKNLMRRVLRG